MPRGLSLGLYCCALFAWYSALQYYFEPLVTRTRPAVGRLAARASEAPHTDIVTVVPELPAMAIAGGPARQAEALSRQAETPAIDLGARIATSAAVAPAAATSDAQCSPGRRPYHLLLTAQGTTYNQWQARIMYHHWKKQRAVDGPCTEMSAFTRLCASLDGLPDGIEAHIPSVFVKQLTPEVLAKYGHFGVLNRPHSVMEFFKSPALRARVTERFVMLAETDHVLMKPLPNLATRDEPPQAAAHAFGYMHAGRQHQKVVELVDPSGDWSKLQPIGPSPVIIAVDQLERVVPRWLEYSYKLRADPMPATLIQDWVLEMWGYAIAAASLGVRHVIVPNFQIEPNAYARTPADFHTQSYIFHYTYGIEYKLSGQPQGFNTIGEWSLDKRHYGGAYPPPNLDPPPANGPNPSSVWLHKAWNDAIVAAGETWPATNAMGTVGWRRESITSAEIAKSVLASAVLGTQWTWSGIKFLEFKPAGVLKSPWGEGKWGIAMRPKGLPQCGKHECLFVDFSGAAHHAYFEWSSPPGLAKPILGKFESVRVGDGELVKCARHNA